MPHRNAPTAPRAVRREANQRQQQQQQQGQAPKRPYPGGGAAAEPPAMKRPRVRTREAVEDQIKTAKTLAAQHAATAVHFQKLSEKEVERAARLIVELDDMPSEKELQEEMAEKIARRVAEIRADNEKESG